MILKGNSAKIILEFLLKNFEGEGKNWNFQYAGYYKDKEYYMCFDNTHGSCYVEQTKSKKKQSSGARVK